MNNDTNSDTLRKKSFAFALRVVTLYKYLQDEKKEHTMSKQLLRAGTAIGAMIHEAEYAESKSDVPAARQFFRNPGAVVPCSTRTWGIPGHSLNIHRRDDSAVINDLNTLSQISPPSIVNCKGGTRRNVPE